MFDPWLTTSHPYLLNIAGQLTEGYANAPGRERRIKQRDKDNLRAVLLTILANLALAARKAGPVRSKMAMLSGQVAGEVPEGELPSIGISLRTAKQKQTRYDRDGFTGLPAALERMGKRGVLLGTITLEKSYVRGTASKITLGYDTARNLQTSLGLTPQHFLQAEGHRETIILARTERDYIDGTVSRELIDYEDTADTLRYRAEMERLNAFIAQADIRMEYTDSDPFMLTTARHLRRYFNMPPGSNEHDPPRFDLGGRLFGGWWQELPRARRHGIRINGEPIVDLDFVNMMLRLAYLEAGEEPRDGDLYAIPGLEDLPRDGIKKLVSAQLFRASPMTQIPRSLKGELPKGIGGPRVSDAILADHPALKRVFGIGLSLMFTESQILVAALLKLRERGVPALPMHDGLMVARSRTGAAIDAMEQASLQVTSVKLPISLKS
jgi:hypothetical protein